MSFILPTEGYVIFSGPGCSRCDDMKRKLKSMNIEYTELNVRENIEAFNFLKSKGFSSIPQLFLDGQLTTLK